MQRFRLAIMSSHPIPYRVPLYRLLSKRPDLELQVVFGDDYGVRPRPSEWGVEHFVWRTNITEGYPHVFLRNFSPRPHPSTFTGKLNPGMLSCLYRFRPNALIATGYSGVFHLQAILLARMLGIPILFLGENNALDPQPNGLRGWIKPRVLRRLYKLFAAFLAIGNQNREHYKMLDVPSHQIFPFPYAVDNRHFSHEAERLSGQREALRDRWGIPSGSTCVVYAGRLAPEKNLAELVRGVAGVAGLHLLIVGAGSELRTLEELASTLIPRRHTFAGFLNQDRLSEAYAASDVFALTSHREPWGLVCNEAMNFGLPLVLSNRVGCSSDLVSEGKTGWTYPIGDLKALSHGLQNAAEAVRYKRDEIAQSVRQHISTFDHEQQVEGVIQAIHSILSSNSLRSRQATPTTSDYRPGY